MNPDDLLDRAARSLRDQTRESVHSGDQTLAQVLTTLRVGRRRRRVVLAGLVPLGTLFFGLAGWATATGRWSTFLPSQLAPGPQVAPHQEVVRRGRPRPIVVPRDLGPGADVVPLAPSDGLPVPQAALPQPVPYTAPVATTLGRLAPRPPKAAAAAPPAAPPVVVPPAREPAAAEDELYRQAHEAHFARKDFAAALVAWNRYVMLGPKARFFMEARYNRAIALVRLGRNAEAVEALRPFAASPPGSYRRAEARGLLRFLGVPAAAVP